MHQNIKNNLKSITRDFGFLLVGCFSNSCFFYFYFGFLLVDLSIYCYFTQLKCQNILHIIIFCLFVINLIMF